MTRVSHNIQFSGRRVAIATMHKKEKVIAPIVKTAMGLLPFFPWINTDLLGTFSGEVVREMSPIEAVRKKCNIAMKKSGCNFCNP